MVFYRKYRPQTIDELDNARVRETLSATLANVADGLVPHAFLFTGPKGLGKTSAARIVAKVVNCLAKRDLASPDERVSKVPKVSRVSKEKKILDTSDTPDALDILRSIEPCNQCDACVSITNGTNVDILEIDAASNRGIDEIRDLKEKIRLAPVLASKKIYIIDEVHMLTSEAFNALLKTLEEPPPHALFILCTTELHKVPQTIISRCFHIPFTKATDIELKRSLQRVVKGEGISVDEDGLSALVSLADGGFRDGVKMLEEVASLVKDKKLTKQIIEEHFSLSGYDSLVAQLIESLFKKDVKNGLSLIDQLVKQGVDMEFFSKQLLAKLHELLLAKAGVIASEKQQFDFALLPEIQSLLSFLVIKLQEYQYAFVPQLPLELAVIEWGTLPVISKEEQLRDPLQTKTDGIAAGNSEISHPQSGTGNDRRGVTVSSLRKHVGNMQKVKAMYGESSISSKQKSEDTVGVPQPGLSILQSDGEKTSEWMHEFWEGIIQKIKTKNHTIAGVLRGCSVKSFDKQNLIIQTPYKFHKEKLDSAKTKLLLETVCQELTGNPVAISVELKGK